MTYPHTPEDGEIDVREEMRKLDRELYDRQRRNSRAALKKTKSVRWLLSSKAAALDVWFTDGARAYAAAQERNYRSFARACDWTVTKFVECPHKRTPKL